MFLDDVILDKNIILFFFFGEQNIYHKTLKTTTIQTIDKVGKREKKIEKNAINNKP